MQVHIKNTEETPDTPGLPLQYIVAENGAFVVRDSGFCKTIIKTPTIPLLKEQEERCIIKLPPLTTEFISQAVAFHQEIDRMHNAESALVLLYNKKTKEYRWHCPPQEVCGGSVEFENPSEIEDGWMHIGDCHSHPGFTNSASRVDTNDEKHLDGLHLICAFSKYKKQEVAWNVEFCVSGKRFDASNAIKIGEIDFSASFPEEWIAKVKKYVWNGPSSRSSRTATFWEDDEEFEFDHSGDVTYSGVFTGGQHRRTGPLSNHPTVGSQKPLKKYIYRDEVVDNLEKLMAFVDENIPVESQDETVLEVKKMMEDL